MFLPLPGYDRHGRFVTLSRSGKVTKVPLLHPQILPAKMKLDDLIRTSLMVMSVARRDEQQGIIR